MQNNADFRQAAEHIKMYILHLAIYFIYLVLEKR